MKTVNKIIFNTSVLYVKIILCSLISLWTVPLVLRALGASDYGLYSLVAGVVAMLTFLNASMSLSLQRFMSVTMGKDDLVKLNVVYNTGLVLHFFMAFLLVAFLEVSSLFIFDGLLNIPIERIETAKIIFQCLILSVFFTIISVPFDAVLNANENMLIFSLISIFEAFLKLCVAFCLSSFDGDKLIFYGIGILCIVILSSVIKFVYVRNMYKELKLNFKKGYSKALFKEMLGFIGWGTLGGGAMIARNQGLAILLNLFYGTIVNAAYGIANQVNGVMSFFSSSLQKSINPQLMKSEGMGNRERVLKFAFFSSKFSVLLLAIVVIPLMAYMPYIFKLWLSEVPEYTISFTRLVLILALLGQYSVGPQAAIQSVGKIKSYFIVVSLIIFAGLPISWCALSYFTQPELVLYIYLVLEIVVIVVRLMFAHTLTGLNVMLFLKDVVIPTFVVIILSVICSCSITTLLSASVTNFVFMLIINTILFLFLSFFLSFSKEEKKFMRSIFITLKGRILNFHNK